MKGFFATICALLIAAPAQSLAQDANVQAGEREYRMACAGCHGEAGLGDGPLAGILEIETPILPIMRRCSHR